MKRNIRLWQLLGFGAVSLPVPLPLKPNPLV